MGRGLEIDPIKVETKVWSPPREWRTPPDSFRAIFVRGENDGNLNLIFVTRETWKELFVFGDKVLFYNTSFSRERIYKFIVWIILSISQRTFFFLWR